MTWDTATSTWLNYRRAIKTYNTANLITMDNLQSWDGTAMVWKGIDKTEFVYNAQNQMIQREYLMWMSNAYVGNYKYLYTRNTSGDLLEEELQMWASSLSKYTKRTKRNWTYNALGKPTLMIFEDWNYLADTLYYKTKKTYTYNAANSQLSVTDQDSSASTGGNWRNTLRTVMVYDVNESKTSEIQEIWLTSTNQWRSNMVYTWTYNANNKVLVTAFDLWNSSTNSLVPNYVSTNEYDNNGFRLAYEYKSSWDVTANRFLNHTRGEYKCTLISASIGGIQIGDIKLYPNPVNRGSELSIETSTAAKYVIMDFYGRIVQTGNTEIGMNTLSTENLSAGVYFVKHDSTTLKLIVK